MQGIFGGFCNFLLFKNVQNTSKITLHGNCHSTAARKGYKGFSGAIVKIIGLVIFYYKVHIFIIFYAVAQNAVEVYILVLYAL